MMPAGTLVTGTVAPHKPGVQATADGGLCATQQH